MRFVLLLAALIASPALAEPAKTAVAADKGEVIFTGMPSRPPEIQVFPASTEAPVQIGVWPSRPFQGALLVVDVAAPGFEREPSGEFLGRKLQWHRLRGGTWRGLAPVPDDAPAGEALLKVEAAGVERGLPLTVEAVGFDEDELRVNPRFTKLSARARKQIARDRKRIAAMWKKGSAPSPLFGANFAIPRDDRTTAPFGTRRVYNGQTRGVHQGWDIDGNVGDEIRAPNDGVVTMAEDLYYSGGTLFVDHGGGLYTGYFHMHSFAVKPGQKVKRGQLLGTVGKSGRVTGPHLHWAAKVGGVYIHPASLLAFDFEKPMVSLPARAEAP